jgi:hypothetical protein
LAKGTAVEVTCRDPDSSGAESAGGGFYRIASAAGYPSAAGRWGAVNTFNNGAIDHAVKTC